MSTIYNFLLANIYLYICILIVLVIIATILFIIASNQRNRKKIKDDYVQAERVEAELEKIEEAPQSSELEDILKKMQEDIDLKPEDVVKKFEEEQEEQLCSTQDPCICSCAGTSGRSRFLYVQDGILRSQV